MPKLGKADIHLIDMASEIIQRLYKRKRHVVGGALRTKTGKVYSAVHLGTNVGNCAICAEVIVLGKAISEGETEFDTIVAVQYSEDTGMAEVVAPCGRCREILSDYGSINVIYRSGDAIKKAPVSRLLPSKYEAPVGS